MASNVAERGPPRPFAGFLQARAAVVGKSSRWATSPAPDPSRLKMEHWNIAELVRGSPWAHEVKAPFSCPLWPIRGIRAVYCVSRVDKQLERTKVMMATLTPSMWTTRECLDPALKNAVRSTRRPLRLACLLFIGVCFEYGFETLVTPSQQHHIFR